MSCSRLPRTHHKKKTVYTTYPHYFAFVSIVHPSFHFVLNKSKCSFFICFFETTPLSTAWKRFKKWGFLCKVAALWSDEEFNIYILRATWRGCCNSQTKCWRHCRSKLLYTRPSMSSTHRMLISSSVWWLALRGYHALCHTCPDNRVLYLFCLPFVILCTAKQCSDDQHAFDRWLRSNKKHISAALLPWDHTSIQIFTQT